MNDHKKPYLAATINTLALGFMLLLNYLAASGKISGMDMAALSRKYDTLITPAGYAFSIWGFIFLMLILLTVFQWIRISDPDATVHRVTSFWLPVSHLANGAWVLVWSLEWLWLSVIVMGILLFSLINMAAKIAKIQEAHQSSNFIFVAIPIAVYLGWVTIATVINIAAVLGSYGWFVGAYWAVVGILAIAALIYLYVMRLPYLGAVGITGAWATTAIAVRFWQTEPVSAWSGIVIAAILLTAWIYKSIERLKKLKSN
jgi:hypothetical protein